MYGRGLENGMAKDEFVCFFINSLTPEERAKLNVIIKYVQGSYGECFESVSCQML